MLHVRSPRNGKAFTKVNCPAIPDNLLESELFGYEKGAFTGARTAKPGQFELADGGTIFLDEIAEITPEAQSKLALVLDGEPFMRIGGVRPVFSDVRVVAATNVRLDEAARGGRLREDVFFRLSEVVVHLAPLRERVEDIPQLAEHFNYNYRRQQGLPYEPLDSSFVEQMQEQEWRGNIRELAARVRKFVATGSPSALLEEAAPSGIETGFHVPNRRTGGRTPRRRAT